MKQPVSQWPSTPVHPHLTAMRCTRRTSQKNCFHANHDTTDIANADATDVANDDATDVANDEATDVAKDDATDVANDDATDVANDDATNVANIDVATDVATKKERAHGTTKDKAADLVRKVEAPDTKCFRNAEVATHNSDSATVLSEQEDDEEAEDE